MYLDILPNKFRAVLSRLRLSSHHLNIEVGRHGSNRVERHQRLCLLCDKHDVEDEYHFVLIYPVYLHFRKRFIRSYVFNVPSIHTFITIIFLLNHMLNYCITADLGKIVLKCKYRVRIEQLFDRKALLSS